MKKIIYIIICCSFVFINNCFANTIEIELNYNLSFELKYDQDAIKETKKLGKEYIKIIKESDTFNNELYYKLDSFIKTHKNALSSLTALYMITGMCILDETYELYSLNGEKIMDYLINNYSKYVQGKAAIIMKATSLKKRGLNQEAIQLLEKNYEVILSIEKDANFQIFLNELNLEDKDTKFAMAGYYYFLGNLYSSLNDNKKAAINYKTIIKQYPQTNFAMDAKEKLENLH